MIRILYYTTLYSTVLHDTILHTMCYTVYYNPQESQGTKIGANLLAQMICFDWRGRQQKFSYDKYEVFSFFDQKYKLPEIKQGFPFFFDHNANFLQ